MPFVVRAPRAGDAPTIARLRNEVWRSAYPGMVAQGALDGLDDDRSTFVWQSRLEASNSRGVDHNGITVRVAVDMDTERLVGLGEASPGQGGLAELELTHLTVHPSVARQGLGTRLLAVLTGARDCAAWVVAGNAAAQQFLVRNGFALTQEQRSHALFGTAEVLMLRRGWSAPGL